MTKKVLAVLFIAMCAAAGIFAQVPQMSAGGGLIGVNGAMYSTYKPAGGFSAPDPLADKETDIYSELKSTDNFNDYGVFAFFDITYAMAEISLLFGRAPYFDIYSPGYLTMLDTTKLGLALYGKYPFAVGKSLTIAPLLGVQFDVVLGAATPLGGAVTSGDKDKGTGVLLYEGKEGDNLKLKNGTPLDLSALAIKLGADARYSLTDQLFLGTQLMWGVYLDSVQVESWKKALSDFKAEAGELSTFSHSATFKVGIGYRF
jgi:hypothetical protein